jgi:hypothetical protein
MAKQALGGFAPLGVGSGDKLRRAQQCVSGSELAFLARKLEGVEGVRTRCVQRHPEALAFRRYDLECVRRMRVRTL